MSISSADNMHLHNYYFYLLDQKILSKNILNSVSSLIILLLNIPGILFSNLYVKIFTIIENYIYQYIPLSFNLLFH